MSNKNLEDYSVDELEKEIQRRIQAAKDAELPQPLVPIDFMPIRKMAEDLVKKRAGPDYYDDNDDAHRAFEVVLTAVYGPDIWKWWNKQ